MGTGLYPQFVSGLMCQVGVSKFVDCCRVAGWWTPIFFVLFCPSADSGWDGGVWCGGP